MDPLQYDPRTKAQIKEALYSFLYDPVQKQFKTRLDTLIIRNTLLGGYGHRSFSYKGSFYNCDTTPPPRKMNRLLPSLHDQMNEYLKELKLLNEHEMPYVIGFINQVLNASNGPTDYLRLLPESVHYPVSSLIASCPCRAQQLSPEKVAELQEKNQTSINLMKSRMVMNLLI